MVGEKIAITGSSGVLGTALAESLLDRGYRVCGLDRDPNRWSERVNEVTREIDLRDPDASDAFPADTTLLVHLAANSRVRESVRQPIRARENVVTTYAALEFAREHDCSFLFASSREVYGESHSLPCRESDAAKSTPENTYAASKVGGEALVQSYGASYEVPYAILRFSNVYGRYDTSDRVVPLFIAHALDDQPLVVYGDRKVLDFLYIDDCVDGIGRTVSDFPKVSDTTLNIASGCGTSLVELAECIRDEAKSDSEIEVRSDRTGEVSRFVGDIGKASSLLGYEPTYDLSTGISEAVEWYESRPAALEDVKSRS